MPYVNPFLTYPFMSTHYVKALASIRNDLVNGLPHLWSVFPLECKNHRDLGSLFVYPASVTVPGKWQVFLVNVCRVTKCLSQECTTRRKEWLDQCFLLPAWLPHPTCNDYAKPEICPGDAPALRPLVAPHCPQEKSKCHCETQRAPHESSPVFLPGTCTLR